jgi:hypothetical protein
MFRFLERDLHMFIGLARGRITEDNIGDAFPEEMKKHYAAALQEKAMGKIKAKDRQLQTLETLVCGAESAYAIIPFKLNKI